MTDQNAAPSKNPMLRCCLICLFYGNLIYFFRIDQEGAASKSSLKLNSCHLFGSRFLRWSRVLESMILRWSTWEAGWIEKKRPGLGRDANRTMSCCKNVQQASRQCWVFAGPHYCPGLLWRRRSCSLYFFQKEEQWIGTRDEHYSMVAWRSCHIQLRHCLDLVSCVQLKIWCLVVQQNSCRFRGSSLLNFDPTGVQRRTSLSSLWIPTCFFDVLKPRTKASAVVPRASILSQACEDPP